MLKIAICDNSEVAVRTLDYAVRQALAGIGQLYQLDVFYGGEDLLLERKQFDVIFLDIDMPGMDGIETAQQIRRNDTRVQIIYVTNYSDYHNRAFVVHAFGYIQKPYQTQQIQQILQEVVRYLDNKKETAAPRIPFKTDQGLISFDLQDIRYFECKGHKIRIQTVDEEYFMTDNLYNIAAMLEPWGFQLCHKSFIVNLFYIRRIRGYEILLENDEVLPLAQKKAVNFRNVYNEFMQDTFQSV